VLEREGVAMKYKIKEMELALSSFQASQTELTGKVARCQERLSGDAAQSLAARVQKLQGERDLFQAEIKKQGAESTKLIAKIKLLEAETGLGAGQGNGDAPLDPRLAALQDKLDAVRSQQEAVSAEQAQAEAATQGSKDEIARVKKDLEAFLTASSSDAAAHASADKASRLQSSDSDQDQELGALLEAKAALDAERSKLDTTMKARATQLAELKEKAKTKLEQAGDTIKTLLKETASLKAGLETEQGEGTKAAQKSERLKGQLKTLASKNTSQHAAIKALKASVGAMKGGVASMRADMGSMGEMMPGFLPDFKAALGRWRESNVDASEQLAKNYEFEITQRRYYFNRIQELKGNIRVYCRVRPLGSNARDADHDIVSFPSEGAMLIKNPAKNASHDFEFEKIFNPKSRQEDVFAEVAELITSVLDGFNVCIFAYGQTGSGKTFTMEGPKTDPGVNYRALVTLFERLEAKRPDILFDVQVSLLEIYNESILDLLGTSKGTKAKPLAVSQAKNGSMEVIGLTKQTVHNTEEVLELMKRGGKNRHTATTSMNEASSRSHLVLSVYLQGKNTITGADIAGKLHLVDLAGSERVGRSNVTGEQLKEAQKINYSLSALGNCIQARAQKAGHVPYRDSKLTHLLQDSLEKNSKTLMFVQISPCGNVAHLFPPPPSLQTQSTLSPSPLICTTVITITTHSESDVGESLCSLKFAARVRMVELGKAKKANR
jgi:kinesin family protein C2/C3